MDRRAQHYNDSIRKSAAVDETLVPGLEQLPDELARKLKNSCLAGTLDGLSIADSDIEKINSIRFTLCDESRLQHLLAPQAANQDNSSSPPIFTDRATNFCADILGRLTERAGIPEEDKIHPLSLHVGLQESETAYTVHPLLAILETDGGSFSDTTYGEKARVVTYLVAMAQRWFTAVKADQVVKLWVILREGPAVKAYWADVKRECVSELRLEVNYVEIGPREPGIWVQKTRERLTRYLAHIWEDVIARAPVERNRQLWPRVHMSGNQQEEGASDRREPGRLTTLVVGAPKRKAQSSCGPPSKRRQTGDGVE